MEMKKKVSYCLVSARAAHGVYRHTLLANVREHRLPGMENLSRESAGVELMIVIHIQT